MPRIRLYGDDDYDLRFELVTSETSREALSTYELRDVGIENTVELEVTSLGSAIALLNDLNWYIMRYVDWVDVMEPDISEDEWLSRKLVTEIYEERMDPDDSSRFYMIRGVKDGEILEPLYVKDSPSDYDLHEVDFEIVTRISEEEF